MGEQGATFHWRLGHAPARQLSIATANPRYERALEPIPGYDGVLADLGAKLLDRGELDAAIACFEQAVRTNPRRADAHGGLGRAFHAQERLGDAIACFRTALTFSPLDASTHCGLGAALLFAGEPKEAQPCFVEAIRIDPALADAHYYLAITLQIDGRLDDAIPRFREALALRPMDANIHNNLGTAFMSKTAFAEAEACYRQVVALDPGHAVGHFNLGNALNKQGKAAEALPSYEKTVALTPDEPEALYLLGNDLQNEGMHGLAMRCYERVIWHRPGDIAALSDYVNSANQACVWLEAEPYREKLRRECQQPAFRGPLRSLLGMSDDPVLDLQSARNYRLNKFPVHAPLSRPRRGRSRIRVAYLSSEYREHATSYLVTELFERHDRSQFEIFAFSFGIDHGSPMRRRVAAAVDHFIDGRDLSDGEVAERMSELEIDIAVSLMLYAKTSREAVLAYRPAPIQVNYLTYPGSLGAEFMDYIIVDPVVVPAEQQQFYAERLVHLPESYQVNDTRRVIAEVTPTRGECGLPEAGFVFCSFNNSYKMTPAVFDIWMRLLRAVPGSVLWQLRDNDLAESNLRREARERGIDPSRLVFAPRVPLADHLARHRLADLFVDTLPCNAHTTASDALWAGLPVLTCAGRTFKGRVAGSLLTAIGLPELITHSLAEYEAKALRLATRPEELAALKGKLQRNRLTTPLFNTDRFRRHLESAYREMWRIWESGSAPRPFAVPAEPS